MSAEHKGEYPCPCRGCVTSYDAGYQKGYRDGYNAHATSAAIGAEMYGVPTNQHGKGENP